ncbi:MAG TPA: hypothetical protein VLL97_02975, partial [Acidobacteriota bacterium]|nr:hypothetical protein [Acidobacteriota bacterium]
QRLLSGRPFIPRLQSRGVFWPILIKYSTPPGKNHPAKFKKRPAGLDSGKTGMLEFCYYAFARFFALSE